MYKRSININDFVITTKKNLNQNSKLVDALLLMNENELSLLPVIDDSKKIIGAISRDHIMTRLVHTYFRDLSIEEFIFENFINYILDEKIKKLDNLDIPKSDLIVADKNNEPVGIISRNHLIYLLYKYNKQKLYEKESIFNCALNGIIIVNKEGIITEMNPAAEKITGLLYEKTVGKRPEQRGLPKNYVDVLKGRKDYETKLIHNERTYIVSRSPIIMNNEITGAVSIFQEITEFEKVTHKLSLVEELNHQLEAIINSSFDGIIVSDTEGNILKINESACRSIGIEKGTQKLPPMISKLVNNKKLIYDSTTYTTKNHLGNKLIITASPVYSDDNQINRLIFNIRDITELTILKNELKDTRELSQKYLKELDRIKNKYKKVEKIVANSKVMQQVIDLALRVAEVESTVLILGETGVGKQLVAEIIHDHSHRKDGPFIEINCGAIPENLLESEFFGYEPGTFTGGLKDGKIGIFEQANEGTIFLDEIGDLPYLLQVKLLKVLQNSEVVRLGGAKPRKINVRVVAATNKNLEEMVKKKTFREDLYYRLNIVPITIPPLRERKEDIMPLMYHFKTKLEKKYKKDIDFHPEVYEFALKYEWPGNVRELQNIVERLFVTSRTSIVEPEQMIEIISKKTNSSSVIKDVVSDNNLIIPLKEAKKLVEIKLIELALKKYGSTYRAAKALGVNQSTIARKAKNFISNYHN